MASVMPVFFSKQNAHKNRCHVLFLLQNKRNVERNRRKCYSEIAKIKSHQQILYVKTA